MSIMEHCSKCMNPIMFCNCPEEISDTRFSISKDEARYLYAYFLEAGYISREFHAGVHKIIDKLKKYLGE
jgi:hypothetical protein